MYTYLVIWLRCCGSSVVHECLYIRFLWGWQTPHPVISATRKLGVGAGHVIGADAQLPCSTFGEAVSSCRKGQQWERYYVFVSLANAMAMLQLMRILLPRLLLLLLRILVLLIWNICIELLLQFVAEIKPL